MPARSVFFRHALQVASMGAVFALATTKAAVAGPPFLTDDAQPVELHHDELYVFSTFDRTDNARDTIGPAIEFNNGIAPNLQFHVVLPVARHVPSVGPSRSGLGDTELGIKYRFLQETSGQPQIGIFPMLELATGDASRGLGNAHTWVKLPLWMQKSWGHWTMSGGGGVAINHAPEMMNFEYAGWLVQRDFGKKVTLGGELFTQGPVSLGQRGSTFYNAGGYFNATPNCSVLFSAGHSFMGYSQAIGYVGLYWTWGNTP